MKLVFFDIDGTLAHGKNVPASAEEGLRQLRANGNLVFICTGRNPVYAQKNFGKYADGFICCNGRLAVRDSEILYAHPLDQDQINDLKDRLDAVEGGYCFLGLEEGWYGGNPKGFEVMASVQDPGFVKNGLRDNMTAYSLDIYMVSADRVNEMRKALEGVALVNPHGPHPSADITVLGVDKGTALVHVAEKLGVTIDDTYAFGDGVNDVCMLEAAGHGVAMGNAVPETKAAAEYVTDDIDKDGVYNGLKHYGLI